VAVVDTTPAHPAHPPARGVNSHHIVEALLQGLRQGPKAWAVEDRPAAPGKVPKAQGSAEQPEARPAT